MSTTLKAYPTRTNTLFAGALNRSASAQGVCTHMPEELPALSSERTCAPAVRSFDKGGMRLSGNNWWLRSANSATNASRVNNTGNVNTNNNTTNWYSVRPDLLSSPKRTPKQVSSVQEQRNLIPVLTLLQASRQKQVVDRLGRTARKTPTCGTYDTLSHLWTQSQVNHAWARVDDKQKRQGKTISEQLVFDFGTNENHTTTPTKSSTEQLFTDYEKISQFENLYQAHFAARKNKRYNQEVMDFEADLAANLWAIKEMLDSKTYTPAPYRRFLVTEPKMREIQAPDYRDRVVQHALCDNVLGSFIDARLIHDNCACRQEKGTHFAINRFTGFLQEHYKNHGSQGYVLKADIRKYFASVDQRVLLAKLEKIIPDPDVMMLIRTIVTSMNPETGIGLAIGNQTSQWFAIYFLDSMDRLIKEKLQIKHYSRYMDDMVLVHESKSYLKECLAEMKKHTQELNLEFNEKTQISSLSNGIGYVGWNFYIANTGKVVRRMRPQAKRRMMHHVKGIKRACKSGLMNEDSLQHYLASIDGHLQHGDANTLRHIVYQELLGTQQAKLQRTRP